MELAKLIGTIEPYKMLEHWAGCDNLGVITDAAGASSCKDEAVRSFLSRGIGLGVEVNEDGLISGRS